MSSWNPLGNLNAAFENLFRTGKDLTEGVIAGLTGAKGTSQAATSALASLIESSQTYGMGANDNLKQKLLAHFKVAGIEERDDTEVFEDKTEDTSPTPSLQARIQGAWGVIKENNVHVIAGGLNLNTQPSSNQQLREARDELGSDGKSPIAALATCTQAWHKLREAHGLTPTAPLPAAPVAAPDDSAKTKTAELAKKLTQKSVDLGTLYALDFLRGNTPDIAAYRMMFQKGTEIKAQYLEPYKDSPKLQALYGFAFDAIAWFIHAVVGDTIERSIPRLRDLLSDDETLLELAEKQLDALTEYFGRIEKARADYFTPGRSDQCGTFESYLEHTVKGYGCDAPTKDEILRGLGDFITSHVLPPPEVKIGSDRVPILSTILEGLVYVMRRVIIGIVLDVISSAETPPEGTPDPFADIQLGLEEFALNKLARLHEIISSRPELILAREGRIPKGLHEAIRKNSHNVLRFANIMTWVSDEQKLRTLNPQESGLVHDMFIWLSQNLKFEFPTVDHILAEGSTIATEMVILAFLEDNKKHSETDLQRGLEVLLNAFDAPKQDGSGELRQAALRRNMGTIQEELPKAAFTQAIAHQFKTGSKETHDEIATYVGEEKAHFVKFRNGLELLGKQLASHQGDKKTQLADVTHHIETYLGHIAQQLRSPQLERCYYDVQGDLHNLYAITISHLEVFHQTLSPVAEALSTGKRHHVDVTSQFKQLNQTLTTLENHFSVSGCLLVGHTELPNLSEQITPPILSRLTEGTRVLKHSLQTPFHQDQVLYRILHATIKA